MPKSEKREQNMLASTIYNQNQMVCRLNSDHEYPGFYPGKGFFLNTTERYVFNIAVGIIRSMHTGSIFQDTIMKLV